MLKLWLNLGDIRHTFHAQTWYAGRTNLVLDSDHLAIKCTMGIAARLKKRSKSSR